MAQFVSVMQTRSAVLTIGSCELFKLGWQICYFLPSWPSSLSPTQAGPIGPTEVEGGLFWGLDKWRDLFSWPANFFQSFLLIATFPYLFNEAGDKQTRNVFHASLSVFLKMLSTFIKRLCRKMKSRQINFGVLVTIIAFVFWYNISSRIAQSHLLRIVTYIWKVTYAFKVSGCFW